MEKIKPDLEKLEAALDADDTLSDAEKREIYNEALAELQEYQKWEEEEDLWPSDQLIRDDANEIYPFDDDYTKDDILYFKQLRSARIQGAQWLRDYCKQQGLKLVKE